MFAVTSFDVSGQNFDRVFIKTVDIDIGDNHDCSFSKKFLQRVMDPVWQKKSINFILDHEILSHLGQLTSTSLTFFHAHGRCHTTLSISGKKKIAFWNTWKLMPEITPKFIKQRNLTVFIEKLFIILCCKEKQLWKAAVFQKLVFSTSDPKKQAWWIQFSNIFSNNLFK